MRGKKRYQVYHRKDLDWSLLLGGMPEPLVQADYYKVADVRAGDLEEVFCLTNHIGEAPWWQHPQVKPMASQPAYRSTSVGDVVQQGRWMWIVKDMGLCRNYMDERGRQGHRTTLAQTDNSFSHVLSWPISENEKPKGDEPTR